MYARILLIYIDIVCFCRLITLIKENVLVFKHCLIGKDDGMTEHMREPWKVFERKLMYSIGGVDKAHIERSIGTAYDHPQLQGSYPICVVSTGLGAEQGQLHHFVSLKEENARRIVACVNACEGLSTEMLESAALNPPVKSSTFNGYITMKEKRDDLLVIVKELRDTLTNIYSQSPEGRAYLEKMNSAISKATA